MTEKKKKTYEQYCSLAKALDIIGERWTLLILRELISGPKRFQELLENLEGMGTNLLTDRLKDLQKKGLLQKTKLTSQARTQAYSMTKLGYGLIPALKELARWGYQFLEKPKKGELFKPQWALTFLTGNFHRSATQSTAQYYEFHIDQEIFHFRVKEGSISMGLGSLPDPALVLTISKQSLLEIISERIPFKKALQNKKIKTEGSPSALKNFLATFGFTPEKNPSTWVIV